MIELMPLWMFLFVCLALMLGFPVAFTLAGSSLLFAGIGIVFDIFNAKLLMAYPDRVFGTMTNTTLIAVPLFVLMGVILERSKIAEELLENMGQALSRFPAGLGLAVVLVGMLMAASTGIVGATVVTMGLMSLPTMLKRGYDTPLATGTICATGTLGQIIPPSIALVLLGDILSSAYQEAQLSLGIYDAAPVSVGDLFMGAIIPGIGLVLLYFVYLLVIGKISPEKAPANVNNGQTVTKFKLLLSILPPIALILLVLGSIITGMATPTEAAGVGALAAALLALIKGQLNLSMLKDVVQSTTKVTAMVFAILLGASLFSLVFRGFGGEHLISEFFNSLPGGTFTAVLVVMVVIFLLGFILDFIEITFVVVPMIGPVLLASGVDPVWLGIMIALNLQTSFLTPPFGFALFYLRGVAPESVPTSAIYRGVIPFIILQLCMLVALAVWPEMATWLPSVINQ
ncbi:TRAP transporter large permease subunit [Teredinibacter sp. KSP-S5-2]|uniref:TRAP transporter large permease n=1 Tax=Teredinibacter sp. KSP-S5-2 TaxID=3034506 RepID=UPI00293483F6|nr:TRAP transporter large permease subunit [Teredinibacter sp. KSP-S5-2]WNO09082.1 TRAP transporter large permease subunit [Teredinibacter sp. KSP-S5-2]